MLMTRLKTMKVLALAAGMSAFPVYMPHGEALAKESSAKDPRQKEISALVNQLLHGKQEARTQAAEKLREYGSEAVPALCKALEKSVGYDKLMPARYEIVELLGQIGDPKAVRSILLFREEVQPWGPFNGDIQLAVIQALNALGDKVGPEVATIALHDKDWKMRLFATDKLLPNQEGVMIAATRDERWSIRATAVKKLTQFSDQNAIDALKALTNDPQPEVRDPARSRLDDLHVKY